MNFRNALDRVHGRYVRTCARLLYRRPFKIRTDIPLISFTFDDFPRSALLTGGAILQQFGLRGTYYTSFGLMGTTAPTGEIFLPEDIPPLVAQGHELGCHTFAHCDSWSTPRHEFEQSVVQNQRALERFSPGAAFGSFSYPISPPRPSIKRAMGAHFPCCRGGGQTFNADMTDLSYLASYFMEQSRESPEAMMDLIDANRSERGWLIFSTHDVSTAPTPYGVTPALFERIVRYAVDSGTRILPVAEACETVGTGATS
jgi:peptidoglycan/xylan/chitin deacetylase (PgdA/CDA1 family)